MIKENRETKERIEKGRAMSKEIDAVLRKCDLVLRYGRNKKPKIDKKTGQYLLF